MLPMVGPSSVAKMLTTTGTSLCLFMCDEQKAGVKDIRGYAHLISQRLLTNSSYLERMKQCNATRSIIIVPVKMTPKARKVSLLYRF